MPNVPKILSVEESYRKGWDASKRSTTCDLEAAELRFGRKHDFWHSSKQMQAFISGWSDYASSKSYGATFEEHSHEWEDSRSLENPTLRICVHCGMCEETPETLEASKLEESGMASRALEAFRSALKSEEPNEAPEALEAPELICAWCCNSGTYDTSATKFVKIPNGLHNSGLTYPACTEHAEECADSWGKSSVSPLLSSK